MWADTMIPALVVGPEVMTSRARPVRMGWL
jgi:hypothetical protein